MGAPGVAAVVGCTCWMSSALDPELKERSVDHRKDKRVSEIELTSDDMCESHAVCVTLSALLLSPDCILIVMNNPC